MLEPRSSTVVVPAGGKNVGAYAAGAWRPFVSVVIPCLNEEQFIAQVLERLLPQYDDGRFEIVIVDGLSTDRTRAIVADCAARWTRTSIRFIDNPARHIPVALNLGIAAARGDVIVRMDAHSLPSANYVRRCVELLCAGAGDVVGMPWDIRAGAETVTARAIALAVAHPFGIGDAQYRLAHEGAPRSVDTVPFGVFRKTLWQELGGFNEALLANEDYDFNYRVRRNGGRVLLDTAAHAAYFARPTLAELARQYFRYGRWKSQMLKLHPRSMRWRHAVAPVFVAALCALALLGFWRHLAWWFLLLAAAAYLLPALAFACALARRAKEVKLLPPIIAAFFVIHCAWGGGFWRGLLGTPAAASA
ncbi:MAG: glycosyltransferase family 2 protein [Chloroflexota bacterium]